MASQSIASALLGVCSAPADVGYIRYMPPSTPAAIRIRDELQHTIGASISGATALQDPGSTISVGREAATRRLAKRPAAEVRRLGYTEGRELGRGGLGLVIEAMQQAFDRPVAIKRLLSSGDRITAMQFYAEAVIAAQLEHPNIVPIHDLLSDSKGTLALVMKRVEGTSWKSVLAGEPKPLEYHLEILLKVCEAVEFAHSRGIIHRDLKPENVMLGEFGEVSVMDWGCALAFGEREQHPVVPRAEEAEAIAGTPAYMAPEMVLLTPNRLGPASDVYLLGAILYEIVTGTQCIEAAP